jgi:hypothetical protein
MNQHPRAKEMGITAGEFSAQMNGYDETVSIDNGKDVVADLYYMDEETHTRHPYSYDGYGESTLPNAKVMAGSLNVMNQTGRTPSELVELARELRKRLHDYYLGDVEDGFDDPIIKQLLEKTKDIA